MPGVEFRGPNGEQPTAEQIRMLQEQIAADAAKHGMTVEQYVEELKKQALAQHQAQQQQQQQGQQQAQQQQGQQQQQQVPINPGPPKPEALAVANFLRSQELKPRTCVFNETKKEIFKVKRAIRALESDAYKKARAKNPLLPEVKDRVSAENTFKLLPLSLLALRVSKVDPGEGHEGHNHGKKKRIKGQWNVRVEQQQETQDHFHYMWLYEGSQWKTKLYALGALALVFAIVMFPLWPLKMRQGVWYLSMGMLGLIGLFFAMTIFRLILFCVTVIAAPPGLWLYPNLFEDVGFFDSFRPIWGWQETAEDIKAKKAAKKAKRERKAAGANGAAKAASEKPSAPVTTSEGSTATEKAGSATQRKLHASVEEAEDE